VTPVSIDFANNDAAWGCNGERKPSLRQTFDELMQIGQWLPDGAQRLLIDYITPCERPGDRRYLHFTETKNSKSRALSRRDKPPKPKKREVPILPVLRVTLEAGPIGELVWIINAYRRPYKPESFGNWFRDAPLCGLGRGARHRERQGPCGERRAISRSLALLRTVDGSAVH
jgi:hypothetical protein